jgi:prepilin-type N-terminal cleavage/methylation domain-containing protein
VKALLPAARGGAGRGDARGYTMIEVLMGMAILAVGASGVIAMQKVTVAGVTNGRNINAATAIATAHLEAVRIDATRWNNMTDFADASLIFGTDGLIGPTVDGIGGEWVLPTVGWGAGDPGLGISDVTGDTVGGDPIPSAENAYAYCTHLRVTPITYEPKALCGDEYQARCATMMRVEARTFWAKSGRDVSKECVAIDVVDEGLAGEPMVVDGITYLASDYGWVFLATAIRRNDIADVQVVE